MILQVQEYANKAVEAANKAVDVATENYEKFVSLETKTLAELVVSLTPDIAILETVKQTVQMILPEDEGCELHTIGNPKT